MRSKRIYYSLEKEYRLNDMEIRELINIGQYLIFSCTKINRGFSISRELTIFEFTKVTILRHAYKTYRGRINQKRNLWYAIFFNPVNT